jgi:hypothetical protein
MAIEGHLESPGEGRAQRVMAGSFAQSEMADEGGGKAAFRVAEKDEGKRRRSAGKKRRLSAFDQHHAWCARPPARVSAFSSAKLVHHVMKNIAAVLLYEC